MTTELLTVDMFGDKVGQAFLVEEADMPPIALTLAEAKVLRNLGNAPRVPFALLFTSNAVLPQRIYALRHATLGLQSIFLVPVGKDGDELIYQAIFN